MLSIALAKQMLPVAERRLGLHAPLRAGALELLDPALNGLEEGMKSRWAADETRTLAGAAMNFFP